MPGRELEVAGVQATDALAVLVLHFGIQDTDLDVLGAGIGRKAQGAGAIHQFEVDTALRSAVGSLVGNGRALSVQGSERHGDADFTVRLGERESRIVERHESVAVVEDRLLVEVTGGQHHETGGQGDNRI